MKCLVVVLLALFTAGVASGQNQPHNGFWWNDTARNFRVGYVSGYVQAMVNFADAVTFRCLADKNGGVLPKKYPGDEALDACAKTAARYDFGELRFGQCVDGIDEFYKDFRNKGIHIDVALDYVRDQLKGKKSAKELEEDLNAYRRVSLAK
jgi:hypothetical protein